MTGKHISLWRHSFTVTVMCVPQWYGFPWNGTHVPSEMCFPYPRTHITIGIYVSRGGKHISLGTGAHDKEPISPLISWVNLFSRRLKRKAFFPRKVSYFRESRMSPWKIKVGKGEVWSLSFDRLPFYHTFIFLILQPLESEYNETKVNDNISVFVGKQ